MKRIAAAGLGAIACGGAGADQGAAALAPMARAGASITYIGMASGMRGYLVTKARPDGSTEAATAYATPDGSAEILGRAFDGSGRDLTASQLDRLRQRAEAASSGRAAPPLLDVGAKPAAPGGRRAAEAAMERRIHAEAASFAVGEPGAPLVVLATPASGAAARQAWSAFSGPVAAGMMRLLVIVCGGWGGNAADDAGRLMASGSPAASWMRDGPPAATGQGAGHAETALVAANDAFAATLPSRAEVVAGHLGRSGSWEFRDASRTDGARAVVEEVEALQAPSD